MRRMNFQTQNAIANDGLGDPTGSTNPIGELSENQKIVSTLHQHVPFKSKETTDFSR